MKHAIMVLALVGCAAQPNLTAQAVQAHCQVEALQPLLLDPEHVDAAEVKAALKAIKDCDRVTDAGPAL